MSKQQTKTPEVTDKEVEDALKTVVIKPPEEAFWINVIRKMEKEIVAAKHEIQINNFVLTAAKEQLKQEEKASKQKDLNKVPS